MSITNNYAGFWKRFVAVLVDGIILVILQFIIAFGVPPTWGNSTNGWDNPKVIAYNIFTLVVGWMYFAIMESSSLQATFGKKILGIIVTDTQGNKISFGRATARYFGKSFSILIWLAAGLVALMAQNIGGGESPYQYLALLLFLIGAGVFFFGYLMAAFTPEKQALHDIIARCLVVKGQDQKVNIPWKPLVGLLVGAIAAGRVVSQIPQKSLTGNSGVTRRTTNRLNTPSRNRTTSSEPQNRSNFTRRNNNIFTPSSRKANVCGSQELLIDPGRNNIDGNWRLQWTGGAALYVATLQMQGRRGNMLVRFPDGRGGSNTVRQNMQLYTSSHGLILLGSNPINTKTGSRFATYFPDNFLIRTELDGSLTIITCDNGGNRSPVRLTALNNIPRNFQNPIPPSRSSQANNSRLGSSRLRNFRSRSQTRNSQLRNWYSYTSGDGSYTVKFPRRPKQQRRSNNKGQDYILVTYEDRATGRGYFTSSIKYSGSSSRSNVNRYLDRATGIIAKSTNSRIIRQKRINDNGYPGKEIIMRGNNGFAYRAKILIDPRKRTLYQAFVVSKYGKIYFPEARGFLKSFIISEQV